MALITSAASGNFNAGATWNGGVVPTVGDEARASNGHTITITANATCDEVSNEGTGIFTLNDGITLTANVTAKSTTSNRSVVQFTAASPATGTIVGNVLSGATSTNSGAVNNTSSGTLTITGNCTGGSGTTAYGANNASTGTLNITGNATGGSGSNAHGANNNSSGTLNITGNATGGSGINAHGATNASTGTLTITGNATGGSVGLGAFNNSSGTLTITGNATGGSGSNASGATNSSTGTLTITGNATGGSGSNAFGANNNSSGILNVNGIAEGGTTNGAAGVNGANAAGTINLGRAKGNEFGVGSAGIVAGFGAVTLQSHILKVKEIEFGTRGMAPISGPAFIEDVATNVAVFRKTPSGRKTLSDPTNTAGLIPAQADVRSGVSYNNGNNTGSCAVPASGSVALGVAVDAGFGTAVLTPAAVWDYALSSAASVNGSIGQKLSRAATPADIVALG